MVKKQCVLYFILLLFWILIPTVHAEGESTVPALPSEYADMLSGLPEALRDSLPDRIFTTDAEQAARAWEALVSPKALLELLLQPLRENWQSYLSVLLELCGVLLLRGVCNCLVANVRAPTIAGGVQMLCRVVLFGIIIGQAMRGLTEIVAFYEDLQALTTSFLPLMGAMYAMGGNISTAVVNHSTLVLSMSLVEWIGGQTVVPLFSLCLAFAMLGALSGEVAGRMQIITGKLKKWYTTALSLIMLLLSAALGAQTTLSARADTMGFRTVRFAVSSSIPVVGGGVAEMLRSAAAGMSWLRGVVGIGGVVLVLWLLLPQIVSLLLTRWVYSLSGDVASFLGCPEEGRLLGEMATLYGYLLAVISLSVMTFLLSLLLLLKCAAAFGG